MMRIDEDNGCDGLVYEYVGLCGLPRDCWTTVDDQSYELTTTLCCTALYVLGQDVLRVPAVMPEPQHSWQMAHTPPTTARGMRTGSSSINARNAIAASALNTHVGRPTVLSSEKAYPKIPIVETWAAG